MADEFRSAKWASWALLAGALTTFVTLIGNVDTAGDLADFFHLIANDSGTLTQTELQRELNNITTGPFYVISQLMGLFQLAVGVLFLLWLSKARKTAEALGYPQRHSSVWIIFGFVVPIANFFMPYRITVDTLAPDHPDRHLIGQWWAVYLLMGLTNLLTMLAAFIDSTLMIAITLTISAALIGGAAYLAHRVIRLIGDDHADRASLAADRL